MSRYLLFLLCLTSLAATGKASLDGVKSFLCKPLLCSAVLSGKCSKRPMCRLLDCCPPGTFCTGVDNRTCCENFDDYDWDEFTPQQQGWWDDLGWNEFRWCNEGAEPDSASAEWDELTEEEQEAARGLCYDNDSWNECPEVNCTPVPDDCNGDNYEGLYWYELVFIGLDDECALLGYDEVLWDDDIFVYTENLAWADLTPDQQDAAAAFCWDEESWDAGGDVCFFVDNRTCCLDYDLYEESFWSGLSQEQKDAWTVFGWTQVLWDNDGEVATDDLYWSDLTPEQQEAGYVLCYDNDSWNGCPPTNGTNCTFTQYPL